MMQTPYYLFYADEFIKNYRELQEAFCAVYPDYRIAYSFKTNYTPAVCRLVLELGGYAEVVSDMEYELAERIGFPPEKIIYNGPGKGSRMAECVVRGGMMNLENAREVEAVCALAKGRDDIAVGIRVNFDIGNGLHSRFGIDTTNGDLERTVRKLSAGGVRVKGIHFHISRARDLGAWQRRIDRILPIADAVETMQGKNLEYIDLGSGMFGKLDETLKQQFRNVPDYRDYARVVAGTMAAHYQDRSAPPVLFTEPGTTLVSKYFSLFSTVLDIKTIRDKQFALLDSSFHNAGEICGLKRIPVSVVKSAGQGKDYASIDLVGYTCLEQDVVCRDFSGTIGAGDILEIRNVGGYSIVDKPPFIHPDIPIYMDRDGKTVCVKRAQTLDDIFAPYLF